MKWKEMQTVDMSILHGRKNSKAIKRPVRRKRLAAKKR
jgi:hypothetical protein